MNQYIINSVQLIVSFVLRIFYVKRPDSLDSHKFHYGRAKAFSELSFQFDSQFICNKLCPTLRHHIFNLHSRHWQIPIIESAKVISCSSITAIISSSAGESSLHLSISRNKPSRLLVFPSRQGIFFRWTFLCVCYAHTEPHPRGDWCLCIILIGCHSDAVHFLPEFSSELVLHWGIHTSDKAGRYCEMIYFINLLSEWFHMYKYIQYICWVVRWNERNGQTLHHSLSPSTYHMFSVIIFRKFWLNAFEISAN